MNVRRTLTAARAELRREIRSSKAKVKELEREEKAVSRALAALGESSASPASRRKRAKRGSRQAAVLACLRAHPDRNWTPAELAKATGMPAASATYAAKVLAARNGQVKMTNEDSGAVQYQETAVAAGRGVLT